MVMVYSCHPPVITEAESWVPVAPAEPAALSIAGKRVKTLFAALPSHVSLLS
jgi:hypothetical protein